MRLVNLRLSCLGLLLALPAGHAGAADIYGDGGRSLKDEPLTTVSHGYYVAVRGGATFGQDTDFDVLGLNVENQYDDPGYMVSGAVGMSMAGLTGWSGLRGEIELGYFENDIEAHDISGLGKFSGDDAFGETSGVFGLVNLYYDFGGFGRIKPFVGAGLGAASISFDGHGVTPAGVVMDDDEIGLAYQLSAGANIALSQTVDLELGYRFLGVAGVELEAADGTQSDVDVNNHIIYGGLRFKM